MAKKPKDLEVGDRVERRGFGQRGTLVQVDTDDSWCQVAWEHGGPVLIHLHELRKIWSHRTCSNEKYNRAGKTSDRSGH